MKKTMFFAMIAFVFSTQCLFAQKVERVLNESSIVQMALSINYDILEHLQNVEYAEQKVMESKTLYFPRINLNFNLSTFDNQEPVILCAETAQVPIYLPGTKKDLYYSTKLAIWQDIYSGGRIKTARKLAELYIDKMMCEGKLIKSRVINNVKITFNECLYHKELLNYYSSKIIKAEKKELSDLKRKISIEQFYYEKEILNLLNAIGLELNTIVSISDSLSPKMKNLDLDKCLLLFYQFKSEVKVAQQQEGLDELMLSLFYSQKYPNVSIGAVQEWFGKKIIDDKSNWYVSLNANIPIFDGGGAFARLKQGRIKLRESAIKRAKAESSMKLNVNKSFIEYDFWRKQAIDSGVLEKTGQYNETDINVIYNLNKSYYNLELAIGVELDSY